MNAPDTPNVRSKSTNRFARRIVAALMLSGLVFVGLWMTAFSLVTSLLIGSGICIVVVAGSAALDPIAMVLDVIATIIFAVVAAIAAVVAAVFGLFGN